MTKIPNRSQYDEVEDLFERYRDDVGGKSKDLYDMEPSDPINEGAWGILDEPDYKLPDS